MVDGEELDLEFFAGGFVDTEAGEFEVLRVGVAGRFLFGSGFGNSGVDFTLGLSEVDEEPRDESYGSKGEDGSEPAGDAAFVIISTNEVGLLSRCRWWE